MNIIGITGKAGSGKDTLAEMLIDLSHATMCPYSFADPVKEATAAMFGIMTEDLYCRDTKEKVNEFWGISPRKMAQIVGTDMARNCFSDKIWLMRAEAEIIKIKTLSPWITTVVIPDTRFENEADWVRAQGGKLIHIDRPNQTIIEESQHESENGIEFIQGDVQFTNGASLGELNVLAKAFYLHEIEKNANSKELIEQILDEKETIKTMH